MKNYNLLKFFDKRARGITLYIFCFICVFFGNSEIIFGEISCDNNNLYIKYEGNKYTCYNNKLIFSKKPVTNELEKLGLFDGDELKSTSVEHIKDILNNISKYNTELDIYLKDIGLDTLIASYRPKSLSSTSGSYEKIYRDVNNEVTYKETIEKINDKNYIATTNLKTNSKTSIFKDSLGRIVNEITNTTSGDWIITKTVKTEYSTAGKLNTIETTRVSESIGGGSGTSKICQKYANGLLLQIEKYLNGKLMQIEYINRYTISFNKTDSEGDQVIYATKNDLVYYIYEDGSIKESTGKTIDANIKESIADLVIEAKKVKNETETKK